MATRIDSFWVADHLNSLFPWSMAQPKCVGAIRLAPKVDAELEPWTVLWASGRPKPYGAHAPWYRRDRSGPA
nr:hypothetical protein [Candidatus Mycobacterium methanotrophicum]